MSEASIETVTTSSPLNPVGLGITNNQEIKNQFFSTFSQIFTTADFEEEIRGIAWMEDFPIRMDKSGSPEFNPSEFGLVSSAVPFLSEALETFSQMNFKGSIEDMRSIRDQLQIKIDSKILKFLDSIHVDTRIEVVVRFNLDFRFEVLTHPRKRQIQAMMSDNVGMSSSIRKLCVISEFLACTRGVFDFRQLYKLAPQRAVDMFARFLRGLSKNEFEFKVLRGKVIWFYQDDFENDEEESD